MYNPQNKDWTDVFYHNREAPVEDEMTVLHSLLLWELVVQ